MNLRHLTSVFLLIASAAAASAACAAAAPPGMEEADAAYDREDWAAAAEAYQAIAASEPGSARAWFRLGASLTRLKRYEEAAKAYESAAEAGVPPAFVRYNVATVWALAGDRARAIDWLGRAIDAGFASLPTIRNDEDLDSLRGTPEFAALLEKVERNAMPCEFDQRTRQFDFWIGSWDVLTPQGQQAGTNVITKDERGCVLTERWTGAGGGTGTSINFFDPASGRWNQVWVASNHWIVRYEGGIKSGSMVLAGESIQKDGSREQVRCTWTPLPDGRVRQHGEATGDGGKTWTTRFDLYYVRQKAEAGAGG